jgi:hypothetical protein
MKDVLAWKPAEQLMLRLFYEPQRRIRARHLLNELATSDVFFNAKLQ